MNKSEDQDTTKTRLQKILQGAFSGPPTPLKDIPTREGESRKLRGSSDTRASSANAKTVSRRKKNQAERG
jgi:hypothetical protein